MAEPWTAIVVRPLSVGKKDRAAVVVERRCVMQVIDTPIILVER